MRAPMVWIALALMAGIGLDWLWRPDLLPLYALLLAAGSAVWLLRKNSVWANLCMILLLLAAGALRADLDRRDPPLVSGPVVLEGLLISEPELSRDGRWWTGWLRAGQPAQGLLRVRWTTRAGFCRYGERLRLHGLLRPGHPAKPGDSRFDERKWLWVHGASGVLTVSDPEGVIRLKQEPGLGIRYRRWVGRLRRALANQSRALLAPEESGLLEALLLAEGRGIRPEVWESFRKTGTAHVLVVSGLHVGLIAMMGLTGLSLLGTPRTARHLLLGGGLVTYCLLTGLQPPIVRATLAGLLLCWASIRGLETEPLNLLGAAASAILLVQPRALADVSFQLSFSAVAGLLLADRLLAPWRKIRLLHAFGISCGAWAATAPVAAVQFHSFTPVAPLVNLVVVPWSSFLIAIGFLACGAGLFAPWAAGPFAAAFSWAARGLTTAVAWIAALL